MAELRSDQSWNEGPISYPVLGHFVPAELEQQRDQVEVEEASGAMENCFAVARVSPV